MKKKSVVVLGAGGHAKVVVGVLKQMGYRDGFLLDDDSRKLIPTYYPISGWKLVGAIGEAQLRLLASKGVKEFIIGIGAVDAAGCLLRDQFYQMAISAELKPLTVISRTAVILGQLGFGIFVGPGAILMSGSRISGNSIINTGAIVEHDCFIGWSSHVATGAVLCGGVMLGERVHVGAGAVVKQGVKIGDGATIGMGAVVLEDVEAGATVVGNPGRVVARR